MQKGIKTLAILSMLLAVCVGCNANATTEAPENNVPVGQVAEPAQLSEKEKAEITQEALYAIFEDVYSTEHDKHPEDWSVDFQITDEIGKVNKAIPEDKKAPSNLREIYIEWRAAKTEPAPEPQTEPEPIPEPEPEPVVQQPTTAQGSSDTQNDTSGVKHTPGGDGSFYADENGGSNGKNFNASDLYVDPEVEATDTSGLITGGSDSTEQTEPEAQSDQSSTSTTYPAGTTVQFGNTTYTSTGQTVNGGNWTLFTAADGSAIIVCIDGTKTPCITGAGADVDLGDGGQAMADAGGMSHGTDPDTGHDFCK